MPLSCQTFESMLVWHCAPSLLGLKPADLVSWCPPEGWAGVLGHYAAILHRRGLRVRVLGYRGGRLLVLLYRPGPLAECLQAPEAKDLLRRAGYPVEEGVHAGLVHLCRRLEGQGFPHEIGLFLGYPPEDVAGFCRDGGRGCRYSGAWKVYGDVEQAKGRFAAFRRCRAELTGRLARGEGLEQMFSA